MTDTISIDLHLALVAAERERCAACVTEADSFELATEGTTQITQRIYNTQDDAHAALEKAKRKAWNESLRREIEALITEDTDDGG